MSGRPTLFGAVQVTSRLVVLSAGRRDRRRHRRQRFLGRVRDRDGHRNRVALRAVTRLDRHPIARLCLMVIGLAHLGPELPGGRHDGELVRVRPFQGVLQRIVGVVIRRGDRRTHVGAPSRPSVASPTVSAKLRVVPVPSVNTGALLAVRPLPDEDQRLSPSMLVANTWTWYAEFPSSPGMLALVPVWFCGPSVQLPLVPLRYCRS